MKRNPPIKAFGIVNAIDPFIEKISSVKEYISILKKNLSDSVVVIKCGGFTVDNEVLLKSFASDVGVLNALGVKVVIVHGNGHQVDMTLNRLKIKSDFMDGYRVTNKETMEVVEMVMSGIIGKSFIKYLNQNSVSAIGISCKDGDIVRAKKIRRTKKERNSNVEKMIDLGFVGEPEEVKANVIESLLSKGIVPVISPIAFDSDYNTYSINPDILACSIGGSIGAKKVIIMSDLTSSKGFNISGNGLMELKEVESILYNEDIEYQLSIRLKCCLDSIRNGVDKIHLISSSIEHGLLTELASYSSIGTVIYQEKPKKYRNFTGDSVD